MQPYDNPVIGTTVSSFNCSLTESVDQEAISAKNKKEKKNNCLLEVKHYLKDMSPELHSVVFLFLNDLLSSSFNLRLIQRLS